jgi:hypothetical protein
MGEGLAEMLYVDDFDARKCREVDVMERSRPKAVKTPRLEEVVTERNVSFNSLPRDQTTNLKK